jgi:hypothetical protein
MKEERQFILVKERMLIEHAWQKWYAFQKLQRKGDPELHSYYSEDDHDQEPPKWLLRRWIHEKLRGKNVILKKHPDVEHKPVYPWDHPLLYRELNPCADGGDQEEEKLRVKITKCITQEQRERQVRNGTPSNLYGNFSVGDHDLAYTDQYNIYISAWYPGKRNVSGRCYADYIPPHEFAFTNILDVEKRRARPLRNDPFQSYLTEEQRRHLWYNNEEQGGDILFGNTEFCQLRSLHDVMDDAITRTNDDYYTSSDSSECCTHSYNEADHHDIAAADAEIRHYEGSYQVEIDKNTIHSEHGEASEDQEPHIKVEAVQDVKVGVATATNPFWATSSDEESIL